MQRFYFDFFDTDDVPIPDVDGTELPSVEAAKDEAVQALIGLANDIKLNGHEKKLQFKVRDDDGRELFEVSLQLDVQPL
ncbi:DUF6894 family protein [Mesorhizobium sp. ES1-1]|uniref:DUF6894 family protein n=1 Tax=Mesorhizobium sp. ES1-1 TaxID=2876629 RepID=UPI001CC99592|nr:hypothetical protein [Mesorhizobium sp. ES1-1]MBZ9678272.1 hypothetical protein [Mesorhizobium sp. ES1-1]